MIELIIKKDSVIENFFVREKLFNKEIKIKDGIKIYKNIPNKINPKVGLECLYIYSTVNNNPAIRFADHIILLIIFHKKWVGGKEGPSLSFLVLFPKNRNKRKAKGTVTDNKASEDSLYLPISHRIGNKINKGPIPYKIIFIAWELSQLPRTKP